MGPLTGVRVVEFAGIGPTPFGGMLLADLGADVIRIDRPLPEGKPAPDEFGNILGRGRASLALNLKSPADHAKALALIEKADILIEGFRPGVMERLGLGPEACHAVNPALVYSRMTGWGQDGPLSHTAGHDMNYIALSGALWSMGEKDGRPLPPMNLLGDFGAGSTFLVIGILAALFNARETGKGDVVDAAICDGINTLMAFVRGMKAQNRWKFERGVNRLDCGAPFYNVYECADGKWVTLAALEPQFFVEFLDLAGLDKTDFEHRLDPTRWEDDKEAFKALFLQKTRDEWSALLEGTDACFAPILDPEEALEHPHVRAREQNDLSAGFVQPTPSPRFQNAKVTVPAPAPQIGEGGEERMTRWLADSQPKQMTRTA